MSHGCWQRGPRETEFNVTPTRAIVSSESPFRSTLTVQTAAATGPGVYDLQVVADLLGDVSATLRVVVLPIGGAVSTGPVQAIAGGGQHSLAMLEDGTVWSWGSNSQGQLGDGTLISRLAPAQVVDLPAPARGIAAGGQHSLSVLEDDTVWAWGDNGKFQLGTGFDTRPALTVTPFHCMCFDDRCAIPRIRDAVTVAAGSERSLALTTDGAVLAWGAHGDAQLGRGSTFESSFGNAAEAASLSEAAEDIDAGGQHSLARAGDTTVFGWGNNATRKLGQTSSGVSEEPVPFEVLPFIFDVTAMGAGSDHSLFVVGDGTTSSPGERRSRPVPVYGLGEADLADGCEVGLAVISQGAGEGTISTNPGPIAGADCRTPCSAPFVAGSRVTITAMPAPGSTFGGWHGDCTGNNFMTDAVMDFSRNCFARFDVDPEAGEPPQASFTASPNPAQVGEVVAFDASASTDDGTLAAFEWDFTDDGTFEAMGERVQFAYDLPGMFTARLRVTDDRGLTDESTELIIVESGGDGGDGGDITPAFFAITVGFRMSKGDGIVNVNPPNVTLPASAFCDSGLCMVGALAAGETYVLI